ncbi:MAG TPA: hypothetical protein VGF19_07370 [Candidatus Acidoferrum sp.]
MSDEIIRKEERVIETDEALSTADLAGTNRGKTRAVDVERDSELQAERRSADLTGGPHSEGANRTATAGNRTAGATAGVTTAAGTAAAPAMERESGPLFSSNEANELRGRWDAIQVGFVDEPRRAVEQADNLVAGTMKRLAEVFAEERGKLEGQWDKGENVSTEDLRLALRRYRSFFSRLLSV